MSRIKEALLQGKIVTHNSGTRLVYDTQEQAIWVSAVKLDSWVLLPVGQLNPDDTKFSCIETQPGRCECGKDKHGFMFHSSWCPAAEAP